MGKQRVTIILICLKLDNYSENISGLVSFFALHVHCFLTRAETGSA